MPAMKRYEVVIDSSTMGSMESLCRYVDAHLKMNPEPLWPHQGDPWMYQHSIQEIRAWIENIKVEAEEKKRAWEDSILKKMAR